MGKKHAHEEHENHERWVISFADMMTLLFALFVVLYAQKEELAEAVTTEKSFAVDANGEGKSKVDGVKAGGDVGGKVKDGVPMSNAQKIDLVADLGRVLDKVPGASEDIRQLDDTVQVELKLDSVFSWDQPRPSAAGIEVLRRTLGVARHYCNQVRIQMEVYEQNLGRKEDGTRNIDSIDFSHERLRFLRRILCEGEGLSEEERFRIRSDALTTEVRVERRRRTPLERWQDGCRMILIFFNG